MALTKECQMVRIYVGENESVEGKRLYNVIMEKAEKFGAAGVTVIRGITGFGAAKFVHKTRPLQYSDDLPVVIEIVDVKEKINEFIAIVEPMVRRGLILKEKVHVLAYRHEH